MGQKPTWKDNELIEAISKCKSFTEVSKHLGLSKSTNTLLKKRANKLNINYSHFKVSGTTPKSLKEILVLSENRYISTHRLKLRLIKENYFKHMCYCCGITEWNNKPTPIELEHINGNPFDNRLENLKLLCPNCHAQTETYRGKNIKKFKNKTL